MRVVDEMKKLSCPESLNRQNMKKTSLICCLVFLVSFTVPHPGMSQAKNESLAFGDVKAPARLYFDEVVNNRNLKLLDKIFSPDYVFHEMNGTASKHMKDSTLVPHLLYLFKAFPDLHYSVDEIISEGDKVALYTSATGTHKGEFLGFQPTGKKVTYKQMFLFRVSNGKIVEGWGVVDIAGVKDQLGS